MKPSDRYLKIVEWSEEDQCYVGTCPGLMYGGVHGDDELKVYKELCQEVDEWVRIHEEDGDPLPEATAGKDYSGKLVVRVGKDLHKQLAIEALRAGESRSDSEPESHSVGSLERLVRPLRAYVMATAGILAVISQLVKHLQRFPQTRQCVLQTG